MDSLYSFVMRGLLTEASLDKAGRRRIHSFGQEEAQAMRRALSYELVDSERIGAAERMAVIYTAIHAFENHIRDFVATGMAEAHAEDWWSHVPTRVQGKVRTRMEDEAKFRWHGARGGAEIEYTDFGDLSSIIVTNWQVFEDVLSDMEWTKAVLSVLERSRNIVMHGGMLDRQDIERIGINIRDWIRQAG